MPTQLKNLKLTELSFVDAGANPHARVVICKRDENPLLPAAGSTRKFMGPPAAQVFISQKPRRKATDAEDAENLRASRVMEAYAERKRGLEYAPLPESAFANLDEVAKDIQHTEKIGHCAALTKARQLYPALYAAHQAGEAPVAKTTDVLKVAEQIFHSRVREIQKRDGCSALEAYARAGREFPDEREAYARG